MSHCEAFCRNCRATHRALTEIERDDTAEFLSALEARAAMQQRMGEVVGAMFGAQAPARPELHIVKPHEAN